MGQMASTANSNSGADIRRKTERDRPIYLHVAGSSTSRWYSIEDEAGRVQDDDDQDDDDDDHHDPILLMEGKAYSRTTDRLRRVRVPGQSSRNSEWYEFEYRHVVLNDTIYAMGTVGYRSYNLLEKEQQQTKEEVSKVSEREVSEEVNEMCPAADIPDYPAAFDWPCMVEYRSNLLLQQIKSSSESSNKFNWRKHNNFLCPLMVSRHVISPFKVPLEGLKLHPDGWTWPTPPKEPDPSEQPGCQYSAVGLDNGWIYTLGCENWSLNVSNGKRFDLPKSGLPPSVEINGHVFRVLGATKTKLFAYLQAFYDGFTNVLFCLDLEKSQSQSQSERWEWQAINKDPRWGHLMKGVVQEYDNGASFLFCWGNTRDHRAPPALLVFDIESGVWLQGAVQGDVIIPRNGLPFLVDIGHQKLAAVWHRYSDSGFMEVHWCKFTINYRQAAGATPTFSTHSLSRGARRIFPGHVVDCTPGILLL